MSGNEAPVAPVHPQVLAESSKGLGFQKPSTTPTPAKIPRGPRGPYKKRDPTKTKDGKQVVVMEAPRRIDSGEAMKEIKEAKAKEREFKALRKELGFEPNRQLVSASPIRVGGAAAKASPAKPMQSSAPNPELVRALGKAELGGRWGPGVRAAKNAPAPAPGAVAAGSEATPAPQADGSAAPAAGSSVPPSLYPRPKGVRKSTYKPRVKKNKGEKGAEAEAEAQGDTDDLTAAVRQAGIIENALEAPPALTLISLRQRLNLGSATSRAKAAELLVHKCVHCVPLKFSNIRENPALCSYCNSSTLASVCPEIPSYKIDGAAQPVRLCVACVKWVGMFGIGELHHKKCAQCGCPHQVTHIPSQCSILLCADCVLVPSCGTNCYRCRKDLPLMGMYERYLRYQATGFALRGRAGLRICLECAQAENPDDVTVLATQAPPPAVEGEGEAAAALPKKQVCSKCHTVSKKPMRRVDDKIVCQFCVADKADNGPTLFQIGGPNTAPCKICRKVLYGSECKTVNVAQSMELFKHGKGAGVYCDACYTMQQKLSALVPKEKDKTQAKFGATCYLCRAESKPEEKSYKYKKGMKQRVCKTCALSIKERPEILTGVPCALCPENPPNAIRFCDIKPDQLEVAVCQKCLTNLMENRNCHYCSTPIVDDPEASRKLSYKIPKELGGTTNRMIARLCTPCNGWWFKHGSMDKRLCATCGGKYKIVACRRGHDRNLYCEPCFPEEQKKYLRMDYERSINRKTGSDKCRACEQPLPMGGADAKPKRQYKKRKLADGAEGEKDPQEAPHSPAAPAAGSSRADGQKAPARASPRRGNSAPAPAPAHPALAAEEVRGALGTRGEKFGTANMSDDDEDEDEEAEEEVEGGEEDEEEEEEEEDDEESDDEPVAPPTRGTRGGAARGRGAAPQGKGKAPVRNQKAAPPQKRKRK